jgi:hypothetical protein
MKERPILMSTPMVKAILEDRKTQTRRVITPAPSHQPRLFSNAANCWFVGDDEQIKCPYGIRGAQLWVRETWSGSNIERAARNPLHPMDALAFLADYEKRPEGSKWRPSIFMPRWASRILLEIEDVRVESLNSISEKDAIAEGLEVVKGNRASYWKCYDPQARNNLNQRIIGYNSPIESYRTLWNSINAKRGFSWATNNWVWVVQFRRLKP